MRQSPRACQVGLVYIQEGSSSVIHPKQIPGESSLTESAPHDGFGTHPAQSNGSVGAGGGCHFRGEDSRTNAVDSDLETWPG